ncbi:MAG: hypothetical protein ABIV04_04685 [Massilia sp.]
MIIDTEGIELRNLGSPTLKVQTRKFARELRRQLWKKHFGFEVNSVSAENSAYFRSDARTPARPGRPNLDHPPRLRMTSEAFKEMSGHDWDHVLDMPCDKGVVAAIQRIAKSNAEAYEEVFLHTARNSLKKFEHAFDFYSLPYPSSFDDVGTNLLLQRYTDPSKPTLFKTTHEQRLKYVVASDAMYHTQVSQDAREFGHTGVVPPSLKSRFMTDQLLPYQKEGLKRKTYGEMQITYAQGRVHAVGEAMSFLRSNLVGFFLLAPLDWGMETHIPGDWTKHASVDIAQLESDKNSIGRKV